MSTFEQMAWICLTAFCLQQLKVVDVVQTLSDNGVRLPQPHQVTPIASPSPPTAPLP